jgi:signal transduction histidine kinase/purine-cytosine permease-like protein/CheY-like chemotaxis protein
MQETDHIPPTERSPGEALQRVIKVRRDYNSWVATETLEDHALRFTPRSARRWSQWRVANMAFGVASFLVLEAVGATLLVEHGFVNAFWAIVATGLIILLAGWPISVYAARHGVDMDLLTRGAGFGYIGSTITSLIYACFTFVFFALEAAVMAYALELAFDIPPAWGYLISAGVVVPLVTHGVTTINRLQLLTLPIWLGMLVVPFIYVFREHPDILSSLADYPGADGRHAGFDLVAFGSALTVGIALITQMGEQADYLRFMPEPRRGRLGRWRAAVFIGGPGWVIPGVLKMLGGALLAFLAIGYSVPIEQALDPNQMYLVAWEKVFSNHSWAVGAVALFVVISQVKINVTNAYAGSLAWSNFFSRITHSHPGRVVWVVFNALIALMLMELSLFQALGKVLGLYSNVAIAWIMAVVADLVVNKPMGWSPKGIEFKRAHLYDINPVGVGAMGLASLVSIVAHVGWMGELAQAFSAVIAMVVAFVTSPLIAWATKGRYYLARTSDPVEGQVDESKPLARVIRLQALHRCTVCEREYEADDVAVCPAYQGFICSLCCSLDVRCQDLCKPHARWAVQWRDLGRRLVPDAVWRRLDTELGQFLLVMLVLTPLLAGLFGLVYQQQLRELQSTGVAAAAGVELASHTMGAALLKVFTALLLILGVLGWWVVLTHKSRQVAQEESNRQTHLLLREIDLHRITDDKLQRARETAEQANQAKSRYISTISHELRTPLNGILGYAQLLDEDAKLPGHAKHAVGVIKRGGDHLLSLIEGTLDIARIESGKLTLDVRPVRFADLLQQITGLIEHEARARQLRFVAELDAALPEAVRADERRVRQILLNILGNAVKFTAQGEVRFKVRYAREIAHIEIRDTGPGIAPDELERIFEPFARGSSAAGTSAGGTGLGLTISKMLTDLMGGEVRVSSVVGEGTTFHIRLFLPQVRAAEVDRVRPRGQRTGYVGERRRIWVVDNEEADRGLLVRILEPLGFDVTPLPSGLACLAQLRSAAVTQLPHALLMDLAMPGLDGWATLRAIQVEGLSDAPAAIVSANAFDKSLDNDVGIRPEDFIVKPVRVPELLDWLGRRLQLQWIEVDRPPLAAVQAEAADPAGEGRDRLPSIEALRCLEDQVHAGYIRGVHKALDQIAEAQPECVAFVARLRELARLFQLDALAQQVQLALARSADDPSAHRI